jgi:hypothetical protein
MTSPSVQEGLTVRMTPVAPEFSPIDVTYVCHRYGR